MLQILRNLQFQGFPRIGFLKRPLFLARPRPSQEISQDSNYFGSFGHLQAKSVNISVSGNPGVRDLESMSSQQVQEYRSQLQQSIKMKDDLIKELKEQEAILDKRLALIEQYFIEE
jgi:glutamate/tyrosine decarboxylase-like PLP-dependent enzyme